MNNSYYDFTVEYAGNVAGKTILIIPSYEPDNRLLELINTIPLDDYYIIIVNDGSTPEYSHIFDKVKDMLSISVSDSIKTDCKQYGTYIEYDTNHGKGYALKTAFSFILNNPDCFTNCIGAITADSDGQHDIASINAVRDAFVINPSSLIMGVREFKKENMPTGNYYANKAAAACLRLSSGVSVSDCQTGLRAIPISFMPNLLTIPDNRFEFEIKMLINTKRLCDIVEVPISLIYDSTEHHSTHYRPIVDSYKIARVFFGEIIRFLFSSLSSAAVDVGLFAILCNILKSYNCIYYVLIATIIARIISSAYNCIFNYKIVFNSSKDKKSAAVKYYVLVVVQMINAALLTSGGVFIFPHTPETVIKIFVDIFLFCINYFIQKKFIF